MGPRFRFDRNAETSFYITDRFNVSNRFAHFVIIKLNNKFYVRLLVQSTSQGIYRFSDGIVSNNWFGKGLQESMMGIDPDIQFFLHNFSGKMIDHFLPPAEAIFLENVVSDASDETCKEESNFLKWSPSNMVEHIESFNNDRRIGFKSGGMLYDYSQGKLKLNLIDASKHLPKNFNRPFFTYKTVNPLLGKVRVYSYYSEDKSLIYTVYRTQENYIWFSQIIPSVQDYNKWGAKNTVAVKTKFLLSPLWEYESQIQGPSRYIKVHPTIDKYYFNWGFLKSLPFIQLWYQQNNISMPK